MEAVGRKRLDFVDYLVANASKLGIDVNVRDRRGANALHYAASVGSVEIFQRLLAAGCGMMADDRGRTVLMQAAAGKHLALVQYLISNRDTLDLQLDAVDDNGRDVLFSWSVLCVSCLALDQFYLFCLMLQIRLIKQSIC